MSTFGILPLQTVQRVALATRHQVNIFICTFNESNSEFRDCFVVLVVFFRPRTVWGVSRSLGHPLGRFSRLGRMAPPPPKTYPRWIAGHTHSVPRGINRSRLARTEPPELLKSTDSEKSFLSRRVVRAGLAFDRHGICYPSTSAMVVKNEDGGDPMVRGVSLDPGYVERQTTAQSAPRASGPGKRTTPTVGACLRPVSIVSTCWLRSAPDSAPNSAPNSAHISSRGSPVVNVSNHWRRRLSRRMREQGRRKRREDFRSRSGMR